MAHYRVKRAIILAAGKGERMNPITNTTPKPLVRVKGQRMIDSVVNALHENDIYEIYVVVGYLKEQFYQWAKDKNVFIIENPYYETCNNISSLYVARDYLEDCIVLDGDQLVYNKAVLNPFFSHSGYNAVWCEGETSEWLLDVKKGIIQSCSRDGGTHGWQLYSISRWNAEDGARLRTRVEKEFECGNKQIYWDDVVMFEYLNDFELGIFEMSSEDVVEIDSYEELIQCDPTYKPSIA